MNHLFHYDSLMMSGITKVVKCMGISILWLLCCLPILTAGASTCALYYTSNKVIRQGRGYVIKEFFFCFKENFKQSTMVWMIALVVESVLLMDVWILQEILKSGHKIGNAYVIFYILMVLVLLFTFWVLVYITKFKNTLKTILWNCIVLIIRHLGTTLVMLLSILFGTVVMWLIPMLILIMPVVVIWFSSVPMEKVFIGYE